MDTTTTINGTPVRIIAVTPQGWLLVEVVRESGNYKCFAKPENVIRPVPCSDGFKGVKFSGE